MDSRQLNEKLKKDWEKVLFAISLLMIVLSVIFLALSLMQSKSDNLPMSTNAPKPRNIFNPKALSFLDPVPALNKDEKPFYFQKTFVVKPPKKPTPPPVKAPKPEPKPVETKPVQKPPEKPAAVIKMRYAEYKNIEFKGMTKSASGEPLALISVFDSKTSETKEYTVGAGDKIDGLTVEMVTSDMLYIINKKNETQGIGFQSSEKVTQDE